MAFSIRERKDGRWEVWEMRTKIMVPIGFSIRQMNNERWYVVRHGNNKTPHLKCEDGGYRTANAAALMLKRELRLLEKKGYTQEGKSNG